jgi:hypothetical protein
MIASTPGATEMVSVAVTFAAQLLISAATDEGSELIRDRIRGIFRGKKTTPAQAPAFTQEQLKQMRAASEAEALKFGLTEAEARAMADALFRRMVLGGD